MQPATCPVPQSSVVAALTALARLAVRTSALRFTSAGQIQDRAALLLKQLLTLCAAQQGALSVAPACRLDGTTEWSLVTSLHFQEEEASATLRLLAAEPGPFYCPAEAPATLVWKRCLSPLFLSGDDAGHVRSHPVLLSSAAFLLRWTAPSPDEQETARQQAMQLLPQLADLVDTILVHLLAAYAEPEPQEEGLPADLLATVGHELRGPLTTIQGYADTLLRYEPQLALTERQEFLRAISQAGVQMGRLVTRFLDLAQLELQTQEVVTSPVDMQALTQEALTAAQERHPHRLLLLPASSPTTQGAASLPGTFSRDALTIQGDRRLLRSMLDALLENALTYSSPESLVEVILQPQAGAASSALSLQAATGRPRALILAAPFQDQEPLLEVRVQDHGRGIAPHELSAMFGRFARGDSSLTREVNGLGLGLALCKAIVAQHQGMLWVESALGEGSTFHILLPRQRAFASQDRETGQQEG